MTPSGPLRGLRGVLAFLTVIPAGEADLENAAHYSWMFPAVGAAIAALAGLTGYVLNLAFPMVIAITLAFFALLVFTGFHHLDGLLDFGDGLMVRGSREEKLRAMRDANTGVGGFGLAFFVLLASLQALWNTVNPFSAIVAAESIAKFSMVLALHIGAPSHEGLGGTFIRAAKGRWMDLALAFILGAVVAASTLGLLGLIALLAAAVFTALFVRFSQGVFGGIGGDALGALNELTRMLALLVML